MKKKNRIREGSGMMVSDPWNPNRQPSFVDMVTRELSKMQQDKRISPADYHRALNLAHALSKVLNAIYSRVANGAQSGAKYILRQIGK